MEEARARQLLHAERERLEGLLRDTALAGREDREAAGGSGDIADPAEPLTAQEGEDAVAAGLRARLDAIGRAEARLGSGHLRAIRAQQQTHSRRASRGGPRR